MTRPTLRLVPVDELISDTPAARQGRAVDALRGYAETLRQMAQTLRPIQHRLALEWVADRRIYVLERNTHRWPDGRYYLLDRDYQHWLDHTIAFTAEQLRQITPLHEWARQRLHGESAPDCLPVQSDPWQYRGHRRTASLARLAGVVHALADALEAGMHT